MVKCDLETKRHRITETIEVVAVTHSKNNRASSGSSTNLPLKSDHEHGRWHWESISQSPYLNLLQKSWYKAKVGQGMSVNCGVL